MSLVKSFATGYGDTYYIRHNSDNFTIIDCALAQDRLLSIIEELKRQKAGKNIVRFISTHPDDDHIDGLVALDEELELLNFYCVANQATKDYQTEDFVRYCQLRDDPVKAFYISRGCTRLWMNRSNDERRTSGINVLWPDPSNDAYQAALDDAARGLSPNDISCILTYAVETGPTFMWMGDLMSDFMEEIADEVDLPPVDIVFAPHHGRTAIPDKWLNELDPSIIVLGQAPSQHLHYYPGRSTITQNRAGDITFDCGIGVCDIYVSNANYSVSFLEDHHHDNEYGSYLGTLPV